MGMGMIDGHPGLDTLRVERHRGEPGGHEIFLVNDLGLRIVPLPASGTVVVGRGFGADIRVADAGMSRSHLRIHVGPPFGVEDLHSVNGTALGGRRLPPGKLHPLAPGEAVVAGTTMLLIRGLAGRAPAGRADDPRPEPIVSDNLRPVLALADRAAASMISVLLLGETGVGKDVLAERIHCASPRASGLLLRLNCAAFSPTLLASELFGHEKGAFTGAISPQPGLLQSASGGTVFLDEVGDLPLELQAKLLLVLERREVLPVGAVRPRPLDVRFLSATNRDLPRDIAAGRFRRDLYFRLNGITIEVPPLRARVAEIAELARCFARSAARSLGTAAPELSSEALARLRDHSWPGNVRELRTVIERAVLLGCGEVIGANDIVFAGGGHRPVPAAGATAESAGEDERGDERGDEPANEPANEADRPPERQRITETLARCGGNQTRAAKLLGMSRNTLIARIEKYGLVRPLMPRRLS
jgi:two-component system response regulator AtoC